MPRTPAKYPSTAPAGKDVALWWRSLEQEYHCTLELRIWPAKHASDRSRFYYELRADFPSTGILEPMSLAVRDARAANRPGDLEAPIFPMVVRLYNMIDGHPQAKFWRLTPPDAS